MSKRETWSYSFEWTQPYVNMEGFFDKTAKIDPRVEVANEMAQQDHLEQEIQAMTEYPEAQQLIEKARNND